MTENTQLSEIELIHSVLENAISQLENRRSRECLLVFSLLHQIKGHLHLGIDTLETAYKLNYRFVSELSNHLKAESKQERIIN